MMRFLSITAAAILAASASAEMPLPSDARAVAAYFQAKIDEASAKGAGRVTVPERIVFDDFRYRVKDLPKMPARVADIFVGEGVGRVTVNGKVVK